MLNKDNFLKSLRGLPSVLTIQEASINLSKVFIDYYIGATIVDTIPIVPPLDKFFESTLKTNNWIETLGTNCLQPWFALFSWSSATLIAIPSTTVAVGSALDSLLVPFSTSTILDKSNPPIDNLPKFVDIIDAWSKTIMVTLTNTTTSVVMPPVKMT